MANLETKKGVLNKTRCYLVGSIETDKNGHSWRSVVETRLKQIGVTVFNPYNHPFLNSVHEGKGEGEKWLKLRESGDYDTLAAIVKKIRIEDLRCVDISDFIFAYIDPALHTAGSYEEIFLANRHKHPIFLVIKDGKQRCPLWLFGTIPHKFIYGSIEEALQMIENINNGTKPIDSDRWHLLRPEFL